MTGTLQAGLEAMEIKPTIGSVVHTGKQDLLSGEYAAEIRELLERRGVLVFPKIGFDDDEQRQFTTTLGTIALERTGEDVFTVSLDPARSTGVEYLKGSLYWHFDGTMQERPILSSILCAKVVSSIGGNTDVKVTSWFGGKVATPRATIC